MAAITPRKAMSSKKSIITRMIMMDCNNMAHLYQMKLLSNGKPGSLPISLMIKRLKQDKA